MRPRQLRLGYEALPVVVDEFEPGFNEAEAITPRIPGPEPPQQARSGCASMRPRQLRLGYLEGERETVAIRFASMRPRQLRLGYGALQNLCCLHAVASMRPRQLRLGYIQSCARNWAIQVRFNEAEAITPRIPASVGCRRASSPCFNEAEAITPRIRRNRQLSDHRWPGFNEAEAITPRIH